MAILSALKLGSSPPALAGAAPPATSTPARSSVHFHLANAGESDAPPRSSPHRSFPPTPPSHSLSAAYLPCLVLFLLSSQVLAKSGC
jgi:hypothetical protein